MYTNMRMHLSLIFITLWQPRPRNRLTIQKIPLNNVVTYCQDKTAVKCFQSDTEMISKVRRKPRKMPSIHKEFSGMHNVSGLSLKLVKLFDNVVAHKKYA